MSEQITVTLDRAEAEEAGVHLVAHALMEREQHGKTREAVAAWNVGQALRLAASKEKNDGE